MQFAKFADGLIYAFTVAISATVIATSNRADCKIQACVGRIKRNEQGYGRCNESDVGGRDTRIGVACSVRNPRIGRRSIVKGCGKSRLKHDRYLENPYRSNQASVQQVDTGNQKTLGKTSKRPTGTAKAQCPYIYPARKPF